MNDINEKKWEEALEKIDEKYIDEAAEEAFLHSAEDEVIPVNKGIQIAKIAGGIAASLAVIIGIGALMKTNGITIGELWEMRPSETTTSTMPYVTNVSISQPVSEITTDTTTEDSTVPEEIIPETILVEKNFSTEKYNYTFSYNFTQKFGPTRGIMSNPKIDVTDSENRIICSDDITDLSVVGNDIEIFNEENTFNCVELQVFTMSDYDLVHINIPHKIEGQSYGADNQSIFLIMTKEDDENYSFKDIKAPDGSDFECYPNAVYKLKGEDTIVIYNGFNTKTAYKIDTETLRFTETALSDIDSDETDLADIFANSEPLSQEENFAVYENYFYGEWSFAYTGVSNRYADSGMENRSFSYYGDTSTESWSSYERGFYEDETGWYMTGLNGGVGNAHFIPKNNPDTMYFYSEIPCQKNQYQCIFVRDKNETGYDYSIRAGSLNSIGLRKLQHITGCDLSITAAENGILSLDDGSVWSSATNLYYGTGKTYLNEISENRVRISQRYFNADESLYDPYLDKYPPYPEMQYITFTIDKIDGQWTLTASDRYDLSLETREGMPTEFTERCFAEAEKIRIEDNVPDIEAIIAVEYFTDSTGHYYALRSIGLNQALNFGYGELYYFNGVEYELLTARDKYVDAAFLNDVIYISWADYDLDEKYIEYYSKTSIMGLNGNRIAIKGTGLSGFHTMKNCIVFTLLKSGDEQIRYVINGDRHNPKFTELKNIEYSDGSSGFRAETIDGEKITYSDYSTKLSNELWLLNSRMESLYDILWGGDIRIDTTDSITVNNSSYGFVSDYRLHSYFEETVNSELENQLLNNCRAMLYLYNGKYYAPEMTGYTPKYMTSCEIINEGQDTAEVRYTVNQKSDIEALRGPFTYTAYLVRTDYGWRFDSFTEN